MVSLVKWCPVMTIRNNITYDTCGICRSSLEEKCIKCQETKPYKPGILCPLKHNKNCIHVYHAHCINEWYKTNPTCPHDMINWISSDIPYKQPKKEEEKNIQNNKSKK